MGSDGKGALPNEQPAHSVKLDGFWIDVNEVTNAQFRKFVQATG
ncbi:MAG: formylglycine-generating enzyme family protein, partial [Limisphaerales bacterium]